MLYATPAVQWVARPQHADHLRRHSWHIRYEHIDHTSIQFLTSGAGTKIKTFELELFRRSVDSTPLMEGGRGAGAACETIRETQRPPRISLSLKPGTGVYIKPSNRHKSYRVLQFTGMESYLTSSQAQAYQEAAAMQAVAAQEAFVASINEAQASQTVQLMQQAALAGISLSPAQAAEMAQQATLYAQQAFAQQQTAMYLQVCILSK